MAEKNFPNKIKLGDFTTAVGVAVYPHLVKPDTKWKAEGEFRTKIKYTDAKVIEATREKLTGFLDEAFEKYKELLVEHGKKAKVKSLSKADLPLKPEVDEEGEETGAYLLNTKRTASGVSKKTGEKWKAKIVIADSKGKPVPTKGLSIWSGTELRAQTRVMGWYNAKDNEVGVTLEIAGVQIKKLVQGGDGNVEFEEMEDEDGWTADSLASSDDDTDGDAADETDDEASDEAEDF